jgi:hypothetical protein
VATCDKCKATVEYTIDMWVFLTKYGGEGEDETYIKTGEEFEDWHEYCDYRCVCWTCWDTFFRGKWIRLMQLGGTDD